MKKRFAVALAGAALGVVILASTAQASFHLVKVRAVFLGPTDVSFVELQMTQPGQNLVNGQTINVYNASGALAAAPFILNHNVANSESQRTILIADTAQPTTPDFPDGNLYQDLTANAAGGALCYGAIDCFSWGNFTGNALLPSFAGTPAGSLSGTMVNARKITAGCATALDDPDDTNNSLADFGFAVGFPVRANSGLSTETLCPPPVTPTTTAKKKCKKKKKAKKSEAAVAKKKKCKKKKKH